MKKTKTTKKFVALLTLSLFLWNQIAVEAALYSPQSHLRTPSAADGGRQGVVVRSLQNDLTGKPTLTAPDGGRRRARILSSLVMTVILTSAVTVIPITFQVIPDLIKAHQAEVAQRKELKEDFERMASYYEYNSLQGILIRPAWSLTNPILTGTFEERLAEARKRFEEILSFMDDYDRRDMESAVKVVRGNIVRENGKSYLRVFTPLIGSVGDGQFGEVGRDDRRVLLTGSQVALVNSEDPTTAWLAAFTIISGETPKNSPVFWGQDGGGRERTLTRGYKIGQGIWVGSFLVTLLGIDKPQGKVTLQVLQGGKEAIPNFSLRRGGREWDSSEQQSPLFVKIGKKEYPFRIAVRAEEFKANQVRLAVTADELVPLNPERASAQDGARRRSMLLGAQEGNSLNDIPFTGIVCIDTGENLYTVWIQNSSVWIQAEISHLATEAPIRRGFGEIYKHGEVQIRVDPWLQGEGSLNVAYLGEEEARVEWFEPVKGTAHDGQLVEHVSNVRSPADARLRVEPIRPPDLRVIPGGPAIRAYGKDLRDGKGVRNWVRWAWARVTGRDAKDGAKKVAAARDGGRRASIPSEVRDQSLAKETPVIRLFHNRFLLDSPFAAADLARERDALPSFGTDNTGVRDVLVLSDKVKGNFFENLNQGLSKPEVISLLGQRYKISPFHFSLILENEEAGLEGTVRALRAKFGDNIRIELIGPRSWADGIEALLRETGAAEVLKVIAASEEAPKEDDPTSIAQGVDPTASLTQFLRGKRDFIEYNAETLRQETQGAYFEYRMAVRGV